MQNIYGVPALQDTDPIATIGQWSRALAVALAERDAAIVSGTGSIPSGDPDALESLALRVAMLEQAATEAPQVQAGRTGIDPVADTPTSVTVTFDYAFRSTPHIVASAVSSASTVKSVTVNDISATGCTIWLNRQTEVGTAIEWIAVAI